MTFLRRAGPLLASAALVALSGVSVALAEEVSVRAGLETEDALLGDTVGYHIVVEGVDHAEGPDVAAFGYDFDVQFLGGRPERRSSTIIANGRRVHTDELRYTLFYDLRPLRAGTLGVPSLTVRADDRDFTTEPRSLRVIGPRPSDRARLALSFSSDRVYVEQPVDFVLELELRRAQLPDEWYEGDPWFPGRPPELRVPWFEELDGFLAGDARTFMRSLLASGNESGLRINGIASQGLLGDSRALRFRLPRSSVTRESRGVHLYTLRKTLTPLSAGTHEIPVSTLTGDIVLTLERARGQLQAGETETVFIACDPAALEVLPVPSEGRPPTYSHAVGRYEVSATVSPARVKVGDPMDVTFVVRGSGQLDRVEAPAFQRQPGLAEAFQVAEADPARTEERRRIFHFVFRPKSAGITEIPALAFASFDPEREEFVTTRSPPMPVTVEEAQAVLPSDVVVADGGQAIESSPGEEVQGGLLGNYASDEAVVDEEFAPQSSAVLWLLVLVPPFVFVGSLVLAHRRAALERDPLLQRARTALPRALEGLAGASSAFGAGDAERAAGLLHGALSGYVADRARRPAGGMTAADVEEVFDSAGVSSAVSLRVVEALRSAEASRFGGADGDLPGQLDAAPEWLRTLDGETLA